MQIVTDIRSTALSGPMVMTIGNFDGLHLGHQALLHRLCDITNSQYSRARSALMTFDPHPLAVLRPGFSPRILTTPQQRVKLAAKQGIDVGVIQPFTREIASLVARDFVSLLVRQLGMVGLVVGPDFALGHNREGNLDVLRGLGAEFGFEIAVITPQTLDDEPIRSSVIRQHVYRGEVQEATRFLGRPHRVTGTVKSGDKRGRQIGVPTANVQPLPEILLPANGVYATQTTVGTGGNAVTYDSVTNLGVRPTVDGENHRLETHLFDFPASNQSSNLYESEISVDFWQRLRGEKRFDGLDELVAQIHRDIEQTQTYFRQLSPHHLADEGFADPDTNSSVEGS